MRMFRSMRWVFMALLVCLIPASANAGVFISVGFAPPPLPVYDQPPCPEPGWMWQPGYWAYGPDGYYWVPGTWVPAPEPGMYWTPGYWGWSDGLYMWHPGYWGPEVGYYGGVNYGFGFFGVGFIGGAWHGRDFAYNTAYMHVGPGFHNVYMDRGGFRDHAVMMNSHVAFSGGPGGINHPMNQAERGAMNERHIGATAFQSQHEGAARQDRGSYFNSNHGRPASMAVARPMGGGGGRQSNGGGFGGAQSQPQRGGGQQQGGQQQRFGNQGAQQQRFGGQQQNGQQQNGQQQRFGGQQGGPGAQQQQQRFGGQQQQPRSNAQPQRPGGQQQGGAQPRGGQQGGGQAQPQSHGGGQPHSAPQGGGKPEGHNR